MKYPWLFCLALVCLALVAGCTHVRPSQRAKLADPTMQFHMEPVSDAQRNSILEITERGTFRSAEPGTSGAGCGCH